MLPPAIEHIIEPEIDELGNTGAVVGIISRIPVSYTHLDVYKRQLKELFMLELMLPLMFMLELINKLDAWPDYIKNH